MAIGIDEIDDFDQDNSQDYQSQTEEYLSNEQDLMQDSNESNDFISEILKDRGISDKNKIKFEDDNGIVSERSWDDLSSEEKRTIINQNPDLDPDTELDDEEIEFINQIRASNLSPKQYIESIKKQEIQQYEDSVANNQESEYQVDELNDDELFILDMQYRSPNITEEEAYQALQVAKENPELFTKQMEGIRTHYKSLEEDLENQKQLEYQEQQNKRFQEYSNSIIDSIQNIDSIGNMDLDLSDDDKNEIANFILGKDQAGVNWFSKALEDTDTVVRMAWFALHGEDAFNDIENYISQQIKVTAQNAYNKGLEDGKKNKTVIINNPLNPKREFNVNDIDF